MEKQQLCRFSLATPLNYFLVLLLFPLLLLSAQYLGSIVTGQVKFVDVAQKVSFLVIFTLTVGLLIRYLVYNARKIGSIIAITKDKTTLYSEPVLFAKKEHVVKAIPISEYGNPDMTSPITAITLGAGARGNTYGNYAARFPNELNIIGVAEPIPLRNERYAKKHSIPDLNRFVP